MTPDMMIYAAAAIGFLVIVGIGFAFAGNSSSATARAKQMMREGKAKGGRSRRLDDSAAARRKQSEVMRQTLRAQQEQRKKTLLPQDMKAKIERAGLTIDVSTFWIFSAVLGVGAAALAFMSGADGMEINGMSFKSRPLVVVLAGFVGFMGLPRVMLGFLTKGRFKKITSQFADGIDVIVRGVKSGLPLSECLRIIARESPDPLKAEFVRITDSIAMGTSIDRALATFYRRVPIPEVNFFVIVLSIQAKAGGNLSEALGNLSTVIRSRKMMREKVSALSSEAKASAMIIGALPFAVMLMVYLTTPDYMIKLFTTSTGHFILLIGAAMMSAGVFIMRKMINFDM